VCQAVFAARMANMSNIEVKIIEPFCEFLCLDLHSIYSTPRYCVLSRGSPALLG